MTPITVLRRVQTGKAVQTYRAVQTDKAHIYLNPADPPLCERRLEAARVAELTDDVHLPVLSGGGAAATTGRGYGPGLLLCVVQEGRI